jgi:predicted site-specific integrase-resolvase
VVAHRDRLCRFGFELVQWICDKSDTKLVVLEQTSLSPTEELTKDLLSIIHVFSCRLYGLRKYSSSIKKDKDLPDSKPKENS